MLGIVALLAFIIGAYKLLAWAFYVRGFHHLRIETWLIVVYLQEPPTESTPVNKGGLPEFSTSLGCLNSPYYLNNTKTHAFDAPMHPQRFDHGVDIHGGAVGTIIVHAASHDSPNIRYEVSLRSNDRDFIQRSVIKLPKKDAAGNVFSSETLISTPYLPKENPDLCARFDVKMYVPPSLKKLHLSSHALAHIKFDKDAKLKLENLYMTLYGMDRVNMIQSSTDVKADKTALEVTRGWIVGDVAVVDEATIRTQRGDGNVRVDVYPEPAKDQKAPETVLFETTTGAGRTKVVYHRNKGVKRPIEARHISARNGPMEFTYKDAGFSGLIGIEANQLKETGLEKLENVVEGEGEQWTHYVGSKDGTDKISINSRGWVGLYL